MPRGDFRRREPKKPKKAAKVESKLVSIAPVTADVEVVPKGKKKKETEAEKEE